MLIKNAASLIGLLLSFSAVSALPVRICVTSKCDIVDINADAEHNHGPVVPHPTPHKDCGKHRRFDPLLLICVDLDPINAKVVVNTKNLLQRDIDIPIRAPVKANLLGIKVDADVKADAKVDLNNLSKTKIDIDAKVDVNGKKLFQRLLDANIRAPVKIDLLGLKVNADVKADANVDLNDLSKAKVDINADVDVNGKKPNQNDIGAPVKPPAKVVLPNVDVDADAKVDLNDLSKAKVDINADVNINGKKPNQNDTGAPVNPPAKVVLPNVDVDANVDLNDLSKTKVDVNVNGKKSHKNDIDISVDAPVRVDLLGLEAAVKAKADAKIDLNDLSKTKLDIDADVQVNGKKLHQRLLDANVRAPVRIDLLGLKVKADVKADAKVDLNDLSKTNVDIDAKVNVNGKHHH